LELIQKIRHFLRQGELSRDLMPSWLNV
jgi:hypothetical protein